MNLLFESGTTEDDLLKYVDEIREKLDGKLPENQIEYLISDYISNIADIEFICDSCQEKISDYNPFTCTKCNLKYDLCENCPITSTCPKDFGCNLDENLDDSDSENNENSERNEEEKIMINGDPSKLALDVEKSRGYPISIMYMNMEVTYEVFENLWLHFRTNNERCLEKYGVPDTQIKKLKKWDHYNLYFQMAKVFEKFMDIDEEVDEKDVLFMSINFIKTGDTLMIKRLDLEDRSRYNFKFCMSFVKNDNPDYNEAKVRDGLKNMVETRFPDSDLYDGSSNSFFNLHTKFSDPSGEYQFIIAQIHTNSLFV